mgnify:CR=1 FL=1
MDNGHHHHYYPNRTNKQNSELIEFMESKKKMPKIESKQTLFFFLYLINEKAIRP